MEENIKYVGIADFKKQSIIVDYIITSKKDKLSSVYI
jgi:hypothetical protein